MTERQLAVFRLHLTDRVGAVTYKKLVRAFGSPEAALAAPESRLAEVSGIGRKIAREIASARSESAGRAEEELELAREHGVSILTLDDEDYPRALRTIYDPPLVLYVKGEITKRDGLACAIVGTRRSSYYGRSQAERIAGHLAGLGFTIVSGLARGIDSAAHRGALAGGGRTIAVLGNGLASVYPPENTDLAGEIERSGAVVSEFPREVEPFRDNFPRRNRVISGLSLGVLVVEGNRRSGSMITAKFASEQGREVFALPGKVDSPIARGPHALIKDGAKLVEGPEDILDEIGPSADVLDLAGSAKERDEAEEGKGGEEGEAVDDAEAPDSLGSSGSSATKAEPTGRKPRKGGSRGKGKGRETTPAERGTAAPAPAKDAYPGLSPTEKRLLACLSSDARDIDDITAEVELSPAEVSAGLLVLEIRRLARQLPGKMFVRLR
jgi:DNA processing protein